MLRRTLLCLVSIILLSTVAAFGVAQPIVNCQVSRITVPVAEKDGKLTCAASFMYGEYVKEPNSIEDMLRSPYLIGEFAKLSEESRWQYPEYVVIKYVQQWKADNKEGILSCYEPGYSRDKEEKWYKPLTKEQKAFWEPFTELVFLAKAHFGPYVRVTCTLREVPAPGSSKKGRGFPGSTYLKRVGNRYMISHEIGDNHLFAGIVGKYLGRKVLGREDIPLNPDTSNMKWFALDVNTASPPENKKMLSRFSTGQKSQITESFSDNYLRVYVSCEPINIQLKSGEQLPGLSPELRFYESALTAQKFGTESEILANWSGKSKDLMRRYIEDRKKAGQWPESRISLLGQDPTILALLRTSTNTIVYFTDRFRPRTLQVSAVGLLVDKNGNYSLSNVNVLPAIYRDKLFMNAVKVLYGQQP